MIENAQGNLLQAGAEALVNTVNCEGVMGKGIALQFKQAYPEMAKAYEKACTRGDVVPGRMQVWETGALAGPKYIINFPTKREWYKKSRYEDIQSGLAALVAEIQRLKIESIAVPPLGCGNGGLSWAKVRPMIEAAFAALPGVRVLLFAPAGAPAAAERVVNTQRPKLTRARALFLAAIDRYSVLAYSITLLEIQKLAYFLQEAGEPLRLKFQKAPYGPYADNLNKVLEVLEGHYTHGFDGERSPEKEITLGAEAAKEAESFLASEEGTRQRLSRVAELIEGFETPYGMELLSSVHYVATHDAERAASADDAVRLVHGWNAHKQQAMSAEHIRLAWNHLQSRGWIG
ncbi:MAG: macro domain-containing protein [Phycisphaerales bacterium]|nr:macro domain-containing protein [Phycisphaerales bacterium]